MRRLYICERPYPLYRTLIKCVYNLCPDENDILISNHVDGIERIYPVLQDSGIFKNIYYFDDKLYRQFNSYGTDREYNQFPKGAFVLLKKLKMYLELQKKARGIVLPEGLNIDSYDEIFVNDATSTMMLYLCSQKRSFIWVEHAKNVYQLKFQFADRIVFRIMPILEKMGLVYALHGMTRYAKEIEVNDKHNLIPLVRKKCIREVNIDKMCGMMSVEEKEWIFCLYCKAYGLKINYSQPAYIILTGPLYADGYVSSEDIQLTVYKNLIIKKIGPYDFYDNVFIKPHPRDEVDYSKLLPGVAIVDRCISAEIFALSSKLRLDGVYAIQTTALSAFTTATVAENIGLEHLPDFY